MSQRCVVNTNLWLVQPLITVDYLILLPANELCGPAVATQVSLATAVNLTLSVHALRKHINKTDVSPEDAYHEHRMVCCPAHSCQ
jgi:hypothetical protein